jgi:hypothetical protein
MCHGLRHTQHRRCPQHAALRLRHPGHCRRHEAWSLHAELLMPAALPTLSAVVAPAAQLPDKALSAPAPLSMLPALSAATAASSLMTTSALSTCAATPVSSSLLAKTVVQAPVSSSLLATVPVFLSSGRGTGGLFAFSAARCAAVTFWTFGTVGRPGYARVRLSG